jgi:hypothetical protein
MGKPTFMSDQLRGAPQSKQLQFLSDKLRGGASGSPRSGSMGLGAAMSGPKVGLGTGMGMNKMAGAGVALGKAFGAKKGGKVSSKMGAVKTSAKPDGIAQRGKTNCKMR